MNHQILSPQVNLIKISVTTPDRLRTFKMDYPTKSTAALSTDILRLLPLVYYLSLLCLIFVDIVILLSFCLFLGR